MCTMLTGGMSDLDHIFQAKGSYIPDRSFEPVGDDLVGSHVTSSRE